MVKLLVSLAMIEMFVATALCGAAALEPGYEGAMGAAGSAQPEKQVRRALAYTFENPFDAPGVWYKGNLHTHTSNSDGSLAPEEVIRLYADGKYNFLAITDHGHLTRLPQRPDYPLLIPGEELSVEQDGVGYDIVALGIGEEISLPADATAQSAIDVIRQQGALAALAHPHASGQTWSDLADLEGAWGLEVFNFVCEDGNGSGLSSVHWDELLARGKRLAGLAVDDAHSCAGDHLQAWVMLRAPELGVEAVLQALAAGRFYASQGPTIEHVSLSDGVAHVRCSPAQVVRFISADGRGQCVSAPAGEGITEAEAGLPEDGRYLRIEVEDAHGLRAWTNPIFLS